MTERKFTPPTIFPAEYVDEEGNKSVILGRGPHKELPFIGYDADGDASSWTKKGEHYTEVRSTYDLHDIPKRITTWHNVYPNGLFGRYDSREEADENSQNNYRRGERLCRHRIEWDADTGGNPEIFVEEV